MQAITYLFYLILAVDAVLLILHFYDTRKANKRKAELKQWFDATPERRDWFYLK